MFAGELITSNFILVQRSFVSSALELELKEVEKLNNNNCCQTNDLASSLASLSLRLSIFPSVEILEKGRKLWK